MSAPIVHIEHKHLEKSELVFILCDINKGDWHVVICIYKGGCRHMKNVQVLNCLTYSVK